MARSGSSGQEGTAGVRRGRDRWGLLALAVAGFVLSLLVHHLVMPHTSGNADEVVYRFQADMYRSGLATLPDDGPVFRPWMSGVVDGERLMVFPAGWPALLALGGALTTSYPVTVALVVAGLGPAMWWFVREATGDRRAAWVGAVLTVASPLVVVHSGTLLSYLPAVLCEAVFAASVLRARRTGHLRALAAGGLALGVLFALRPLDAGLIALPFGALLLWSWRHDLRRAVAGSAWGAAGAAVPVLAVLAYNRRVTGAPWTFPIEAADGNNAFGFGPRHIAEGTPVEQITFGGQVGATARNLAELPQWLPGTWVALPFLVVGAVVLWRRHRAIAATAAALTVLFPLAYLFYWGTFLLSRGRHDFGPFYYAALWLPAAAAVGLGVVTAWDHVRDRIPAIGAPSGRAALSGTAAVGLVVVSSVVLQTPLDTFERYTDRAEQQLEAVEGLPDDSLVVLPVGYDGPWILHPWNQYANEPDLDGEVVYAADAGAPTVDALDRFGDRRAFSLLAPEGPGNAGPLVLDPLDVVRAPWVEVRVEVGELAPAAAFAHLLVGDTGVRCPITAAPPGGATVVTWRTDGQRVEAVSGCAGPLEAVPPVPDGQRDCVAGAQGGEGADRTIREERFWCRAAPEPGALMTFVRPGEPRIGSDLDAPRPRWSALPREEAERHLRVVVAATEGAPSAAAP